jgi:hypothetical protein
MVFAALQRKMSQNEEYQRLARKFIDAWQEQMAALSNDGEFIRTLLHMMQMPSFSDLQGSPYATYTRTQPPGSYRKQPALYRTAIGAA